MATFAVGDIHGRLDALDDLLVRLAPEVRPALRGRTIGLDTISHGVLTAIRLPDRRIFQSGRHPL
jgi:hypothetical protein